MQRYVVDTRRCINPYASMEGSFYLLSAINERDICGVLKKKIPLEDKTAGSVLAHIYWRLGHECGTICRIFSESKFSWGTYEDPLGFHCNSHINNLILLPQGKPGSPLLAPLDFDMAFTQKTFSRDSKTWEEWMTLEKNGMKLVLAGDEEINSGVTATVQFGKEFSLLRCALRDTMMVAYNQALAGEPDTHPPILELDDAVHALLKLALIITENELA